MKSSEQEHHQPFQVGKECGSVVAAASEPSRLAEAGGVVLRRPQKVRGRGASFGDVTEINYLASDSEEAPPTPSTTAPDEKEFSKEFSSPSYGKGKSETSDCVVEFSEVCPEEARIDLQGQNHEADAADESHDDFSYLEQRRVKADLKKIRRAATASIGMNPSLRLPTISRSTLWKRRDIQRHSSADVPVDLIFSPPERMKFLEHDTPT
mmetsp:Transcript_35050/g.64021  ORF Transcript_35050/g.64021 Transcript_35050/m.64021 type:complete len:209 (+) Transcript_35050:1-627(+)